MQNNVCAGCGTKFEEVMKNGIVGCPKCYVEFRSYLLPVIGRIHGSTVHVGKVPVSRFQNYELLQKYRKLIEEREKSIISRDFERAAKLQTKINEMTAFLGEKGMM